VEPADARLCRQAGIIQINSQRRFPAPSCCV